MRRFRLQTQVTVDGFMAGPDGEQDWQTADWSEDMNTYVDALTEPVDCIVLGRKLAEGFIPHWASEPEGETPESIATFNNTPRAVISHTLTESPWENATVVGGDLPEVVNDLKGRPGGDMITYGGGTLVRSLIANGLLDELHLFVNPVAIGTGMPVFPNGGDRVPLRLVAAHPFKCGVTALHYEPQRS